MGEAHRILEFARAGTLCSEAADDAGGWLQGVHLSLFRVQHDPPTLHLYGVFHGEDGLEAEGGQGCGKEFGRGALAGRYSRGEQVRPGQGSRFGSRWLGAQQIHRDPARRQPEDRQTRRTGGENEPKSLLHGDLLLIQGDQGLLTHGNPGPHFAGRTHKR